MPSFTDTSSGYVQWQSARRQAKQVAHDAAIDIIEHYNRIMLNDDHDQHGRIRRLPTNALPEGVHNSYSEDESPRMDVLSKSKKSTPRGQSKKTTTLRAESLERKGGVFTEGISSLSRQSQFPLSLKRSDVVSENLPDTIKMAREKSRIYLALSQPPGRSGRDSYRASSKGDLSAKSGATLPPPSSYPWCDMLHVTEVTRSRTFTADDRAGLSTRSTLDSRQTASDIHPARDGRLHGRQGQQLPMFYPSITGAPPNTPLLMPPSTLKPRMPSVSIVSLGGEAVGPSGKQPESRPRLPVPFKCSAHDMGAARGKANAGSSANGDPKATSSKPGIDLPQLPLRYTEAKDAGFQFTPRDRPARMNYTSQTRGRRRVGLGQMKQGAKMVKADPNTLTADRDDGAEAKTPTNDPYASRFRQMSSVTSVGDVHIPFAPPASSSSFYPDSDPEDPEGAVPEPAIMLTVHEEDESGERSSQVNHPLRPQDLAATLRVELDTQLPVVPPVRALDRTLSLVSNASLLSVPLLAKDLSEARPPASSNVNTDGAGPMTLEIPNQSEEKDVQHHDEDMDAARPRTEPQPEDPSASPPIASTSVVDTARTVATQTSLPYEPDEAERRPTVVKIKTLSMFPDINSPAETSIVSQPPMSAASEPLFKMSHVTNDGDAMKLLGLPELRAGHNAVRDLIEDETSELKGRSNGVQNITFISPLEVQQKAKRF